MNKIFLFLTSLFLVGCSTTVPVVMKFPAAPEELRQPCQDLSVLNEEAKLSDVAKSVSSNYTLYHLWNEWYTEQKKNFESLK